MMKAIFSDITVLKPKIFEDKRGIFFESYGIESARLIRKKFWQDNHSFSYGGVIRGLHFQWEQPMGKLVRVTAGAVMDYYVDIKKTSPTYGQYDSILLSEKNNISVWIPPGYAHGFEVLDGPATVLYKCTNYYNKDGESGINPLDKDIGIPWKTDVDDMIISDRDLNSQTFAKYSLDPKF